MKQQRMNLLLRILFIILIIAISGAAVLQIFTPEYMGSHAAYGISTGWQKRNWFLEYSSPCNINYYISSLQLDLFTIHPTRFDSWWYWYWYKSFHSLFTNA